MSDNDILRTVNQDLCRELMDLKVKNETLKSAQEDVNICFAPENIKRRDNTISQQDRDIDQKKLEVKQLQRKVFQLEPQVQQLKQDKDKVRHRAEYWTTRVNQLRICFEERQVEEIIDKQQAIDKLKGEVYQLEEENSDLLTTVEDIMSSNIDEEITTFHIGKYTDNVRVCCYLVIISSCAWCQKHRPCHKGSDGKPCSQVFRSLA